jgi:splicing factor 3B subunit 2
MFTEEEEDSDSESDAEDDSDAESSAVPADGLQTPSLNAGLETPSGSGMASVVSTIAGGLETPDFLELRKRRDEETPIPSSRGGKDDPKSLYHVLKEKNTSVRGMMGSERGYDVSDIASGSVPVLGEERGTKVRCNFMMLNMSHQQFCFQRKANDVDLSIDASELEGMSEEELRRKYETLSRSSVSVPGSGEDFSDMVRKEMSSRQKKAKMERERRDGDRGSRGGERDRDRRGKEFKF